jgi:hypothetical protein
MENIVEQLSHRNNIPHTQRLPGYLSPTEDDFVQLTGNDRFVVIGIMILRRFLLGFLGKDPDSGTATHSPVLEGEISGNGAINIHGRTDVKEIISP